MKKYFFIFFPILLLVQPLRGQYWQQELRYSIDVSLNDKEKTLDGFEQIQYKNNSPDTLFFIWFHVWPNAYKNDKTAYTRQSVQNDNLSFYFSKPEQKGYINRLDFKVNDRTAEWEDHPEHIDIIKLVLPEPLLPGKEIQITTPFHVQLPFLFNRLGYLGDHFQIAHWYPKPAVYDHKGWHPMPMLESGEYYSEFGSFDVQITVPANYVVAATGTLLDESEIAWLQTRNDFTWKPIREKVKVKGVLKTLVQEYPVSETRTKTLHFQQDRVHDFAWFADKRFIVKHEPYYLNRERRVDLFSFYLPGKKTGIWEKGLATIKETLEHYGQWLGDYPYKTVSIVQSAKSESGGTEYPTITVLDATDLTFFKFVVRHEVGHNWLYGILGSNERLHPWMDEGINTFYDYRHIDENPKAGLILNGSVDLINAQETATLTRERGNRKLTPGLPATEYSGPDYSLFVYHRAATWLQDIEKELGREVFDQAMRAYYKKWQFKHSYPEDFRQVLEETSGKDLEKYFQKLYPKPGRKEKKESHKTTVLTSPLFFQSFAKKMTNPETKKLILSPAVGANSYDGFMAGLAFSNYSLPPTRLKFFGATLYGFGSKSFNGIGKLDYSFPISSGPFRRLDLFLNGSGFSMNELTDTRGNQVFLRYSKFVPGARLVLVEKKNQPGLFRYIQWKSFLIREDQFLFRPDTLINGIDTTIEFRVGKEATSRSLGQLIFKWENNRALYPWQAEAKAEVHKDFLRLAFTGNYFFNYSKGGGIHLRLFAGKFIYLTDKTTEKRFLTDPYHLNMSGATGYEDYTYSDYFIGRNRFQKLPSQQIMVRDGGFKIRTDLLSSKVGKTDDWLAALNLTTTIPDNINPLSLLPVRLPIRAFFDLGTYAEAWQRNSELDRILLNAGIQVSLLRETIHVYIPLIYSAVYKDYIQSILVDKRLARSISFSIDLSNFSTRKLNPHLHF